MTNTPLWQAEDIIRATHGTSLHEQSWAATGVAIDSRTVQPGDLFIALKGPAHDGHDHVAAAIAAGAVAALVSRQPTQTPASAPLVFVPDTFTALQELGRAGRARSSATIIAVTGSVGKTGTKEMLRAMLSACGETYANAGGLNNHWGAPLSLARLPPSAKFGVFELGMNHAGELTELTSMARPHIALITTVEAAHLEFFASVEAIADAKAEIFHGMGVNGIAILNRDNRHYERLHAAARAQGIKKILSFGSAKDCDACLSESVATPQGCAITANIMGRPLSYSIGAPGQHLVMNSLGALLAAIAAGGDAATCAAALAAYTPPKGRGAKHIVTLPTGSFTLIDESYNASPVAVRAAIGVLGQSTPTGEGRRILVLGDMRELGPQGPALHAGLATAILDAKIDKVFCCGELMRNLYGALPAALQGAHAPDSADLCPFVTQTVKAGDIVTVKGSLSMNMNLIVTALQNSRATKAQKIAS